MGKPRTFSQDFTDAELDTLNDLFTQWLPITLLPDLFDLDMICPLNDMMYSHMI